jgi:hypothetical protein
MARDCGPFLFQFLFGGEQKLTEQSHFRTKLALRQVDSKPTRSCAVRRTPMVQTKASIPKIMAEESEHAIQFLAAISNALKHQRRHFDDAVVTHCIRLIHEYVDEKMGETRTDD